MRRRGALVSELSSGRVFVERGDPEILKSSNRVALVAQFSEREVQTRSLSEYLVQLDSSGYVPVVISVCEASSPLEFPYGIPLSTIVLRRPNLGYDFGSWSTALRFFPEILTMQTVLLTNDSLLGPFAPISSLLDWASAPGPNIRGLTRSFQFVQHTQSFFMAFRDGILAEEPWRHFFDSVRVEPDKESVVLAYEIGASKLAFTEAYSSDVWITGPELGVPNGNPTVDGWKHLIESGIPFLKRTVMTHPTTMAEAVEAETYIRHRFSTDIGEW